MPGGANGIGGLANAGGPAARMKCNTVSDNHSRLKFVGHEYSTHREGPFPFHAQPASRGQGQQEAEMHEKTKD